MFDTLQSNLKVEEEENKDFVIQDLTDKEEFIVEFMPTMTVSTPEVPQQCGLYNGVEQSKLSKAQKKKVRSKVKIQNANQ